MLIRQVIMDFEVAELTQHGIRPTTVLMPPWELIRALDEAAIIYPEGQLGILNDAAAQLQIKSISERLKMSLEYLLRVVATVFDCFTFCF